jgi:hypothetical protein
MNVLNTPEYHAILDAVSNGRMTRDAAVAAHNALEAEHKRRELVSALNVALCVLEASDAPGADYAATRIRSALANAR